ncbi:MAG: hypothetical protein L0I93_06015, partial [Atopostipes suicloacalis]|nr:hypothetical protein [Atopostipes suicloacalis]
MNYDGPSFYKNKKVKSHREIEKEAKDFMTTPPKLPKKKGKQSDKQAKEKRTYFRNRHIPDSLQHLGGWKREEMKKDLFSSLEKRLKKSEKDFLLFESHLELEEMDEESNQGDKEFIPKKDKLKKAHQNFKKNVIKPNKPTSGLHRSLSKIIAEDEQ